MQIIGIVLVLLMLCALALAIDLLAGIGPAGPVVGEKAALAPASSCIDGKAAFVAATKMRPK